MNILNYSKAEFPLLTSKLFDEFKSAGPLPMELIYTVATLVSMSALFFEVVAVETVKTDRNIKLKNV